MNMWKFETARFKVVWSIEPCQDLDLSWDETGQVEADLICGHYTAFDSVMTVYLDGVEIAADYLGQSIYENPEDFRDHIGMNERGHGSYFSDMVRQAIKEAREHLAATPQMRNTCDVTP